MLCFTEHNSTFLQRKKNNEKKREHVTVVDRITPQARTGKFLWLESS